MSYEEMMKNKRETVCAYCGGTAEPKNGTGLQVSYSNTARGFINMDSSMPSNHDDMVFCDEHHAELFETRELRRAINDSGVGRIAVEIKRAAEWIARSIDAMG